MELSTLNNTKVPRVIWWFGDLVVIWWLGNLVIGWLEVADRSLIGIRTCCPIRSQNPLHSDRAWEALCLWRSESLAGGRPSTWSEMGQNVHSEKGKISPSHLTTWLPSRSRSAGARWNIGSVIVNIRISKKVWICAVKKLFKINHENTKVRKHEIRHRNQVADILFVLSSLRVFVIILFLYVGLSLQGYVGFRTSTQPTKIFLFYSALNGQKPLPG